MTRCVSVRAGGAGVEEEAVRDDTAMATEARRIVFMGPGSVAQQSFAPLVHYNPGHPWSAEPSLTIGSPPRLEPAAWVRSIGPPTPGSGVRWLSRCCPRRWLA